MKTNKRFLSLPNQLIWVLVLLFLGAFVVRLTGAVNVPLGGDEANTSYEAQTLIIKHSLPYYLLFRIWMSLGSSLLWLRLLSIILGSLAVPICWLWLRQIRGNRIAWMTSLLLMISPFAVEFSQEMRFYGMFLFTAMLFFTIYWRLASRVFRNIKKWEWLLFIGSAFLAATSNLINLLLVVPLTLLHGIVIVYWPKLTRRQKLLSVGICIVGIIISFVIFLSPSIMAQGWRLAVHLAGTPEPPNYTAPRGINTLALAKLALNYHYFALGQYVYPLDLGIVVPSLLLVSLLILSGLNKLRLESAYHSLLFIGITGGLSAFILYFIIDSLLPPNVSASATARYLLPILPIFFWIIAEGVFAISVVRLRTIAVIGIILVQVVGLFSLYSPVWLGSYKSVRLDPPLNYIHTLESPLVLTDGRATRSMQFYLGDQTKVRVAWDTINSINVRNQLPDELTQHPIVVVAMDPKRENACFLTPLLNQLANWQENFAWSENNVFVYAYTQREPNTGGVSQFRLPLPRTILSIAFADLPLPQPITWGGQPYTISGMYSLPDCKGASLVQLDNLDKQFQGAVETLTLFSNITGESVLSDGEIVARVTATSVDGTESVFDLRKGYETQRWDEQCKRPCLSVLDWHKRVAIVGNSAFPNAHKDFQAKIWGISLKLPKPMVLNSIKISLLKPQLSLNIWDLYAAK